MYLPTRHDMSRFEKFISPEPNSGCWLWLGAYINSGYGVFRAGSKKDNTRRSVTAHRFSIETTGHIFSSGEQALHKCDNKACVNPDHLYVGSRKDNMRDAIARGRHGGRPLKGAENPRAKLTENQVKEILASEESCTILAERYCVSKTHISYIKNKKSWRCLHAS
jgi:hypothetical protein